MKSFMCEKSQFNKNNYDDFFLINYTYFHGSRLYSDL